MARRAPKALWTATTYFGEGLPWSVIHQMGTQYLTAIRAPAEQIGYTSFGHLAVFLKLLWSPIVGLFGRKRTWVWVTQLVLAGGMAAVASVTTAGNLTMFWVCLAAFAIVHATHDIACDGFYMMALGKQDQALYSGWRVAAFRAAMMLGAGPLVMLAGKGGWLIAFLAASGIMAATAVANAILMPRPDEVVARPVAGAPRRTAAQRRAAFIETYSTFFAQPAAARVLAFMFFFKIGDIIMFAQAQPLLRDIGVETTDRGLLSGVSIGIFIVSTILGGAIISRKGLERCLVPMTFLQNLAIPLYVVLAILKPPFVMIAAIVAVEQIASGLGESAKVVFLMRRCRTAFSTSHYAFATAVVALASTLSGAFTGHLYKAVAHPTYFMIAFLASVPSLILVLIVPRTSIDAS